MSPLGPMVRGLTARRGISSMILLVAVVAAAAAAAGPTYYQAAQRSILSDAVHNAPTIGQGIEISSQGPLTALRPLTATVDRARADSPAGDLLRTTVRGQEVPYNPTAGQSSHITWREGLCAHLTMTSGHCSRRAGDAVVSAALADLDGLAIGDRVPGSPFDLRIVGTYEPRNPSGRYWFNRGYFPQDAEFINTPGGGPAPVDAVFTVRASLESADAQGDTLVDLLLDLDAVTPERRHALRVTVDQIAAAAAESNASATSGINTALDRAQESSRSLLVPVMLITAQLLVLVWLLLFLIITDAAEARGRDLALAKLRGLGRFGVLRFALAESVTLLLVALPLGVATGWGATRALAETVLRPGTAVDVGRWAFVAAAVAVSGGLVAAALAARRTIVRPVLEQWRRSGQSQVRRGWVLDVAVLVATGAAIVELYASGAIGEASTHVLALLVPGLVGLGVAVVASRLLPWACRRLSTITRGHGGIAAFLAVRQVARRPAGMRTMTMLATAFALATFSISAWTVTSSNIDDVSATRTGAAAVVDVVPDQAQDLAATVDRLDPTGRRAMAVEVYDDFGNDARKTIGVDPDRFARIAYWRDDFSGADQSRLARRLQPPSPDPVTLRGDRLRVRLAGVHLNAPLLLRAHLKTKGEDEATVELGTVTDRTTVLRADLPPCRCELRSLSLESPASTLVPARGRITLASLSTRTRSGWGAVDTGLHEADRWTWSGTAGPAQDGRATGSPDGLELEFDVSGTAELSWSAYSWPTPMPALVTADVAALPRDPTVEVAGLDGQPLTIDPVATVPVPGAPEHGVVVDRAYAERAALGTRLTADHQVWLAPGAVATFPDRLRAAGVRVVDVRTSAAAARALRQQGPALALILFLAFAGAATIFAASGAVTGLHLSGRRRRYELSALLATGARRGSLRTGLLLEQAATLGLGILAGVGAGLLAVYLAIPAVPEFVQRPDAPALLYTPGWAALFLPLGLFAAVVAIVAVLSASSLVAATRPEQLREEPG